MYLVFCNILLSNASPAVPYGHKREHKYLKREIEHIVNDELKKNIDLKSYVVAANVPQLICEVMGTGKGFTLDLCPIPQQSGTSLVAWARSTDVVSAKTLRFKWYAQGQCPTTIQPSFKDGCSTIRFIIFTYLPDEGSSVVQQTDFGGILDLAQNSTNGFQVLANYVTQGEKRNFVVHHDETISLSPRAGNVEDNAHVTGHRQV